MSAYYVMRHRRTYTIDGITQTASFQVSVYEDDQQRANKLIAAFLQEAGKWRLVETTQNDTGEPSRPPDP